MALLLPVVLAEAKGRVGLLPLEALEGPPRVERLGKLARVFQLGIIKTIQVMAVQVLSLRAVRVG